MQAGDRDAFERLYDWYAPTLFGIATRLTGDSGKIAAQVLQHSFICIWQQRADYHPGAGSLFNWMLRCMRLSAGRAMVTQEKNLLPGVLPENTACSADVDTGFQDKVLELTYIFGASAEEAGRLLKTSPETVKAGLKNAMKRLKVTA